MGREILPHERDLRHWLQRRVLATADVEDVVQECYCRLAQLSDVTHVVSPRAYLFAMAGNIVRRQRKRARVVRIETLADAIGLEGESDQLTPERFAQAREELGRIQMALATLSTRARRIFIMRKVEGLSQKAIAQALGISESVVENEASRGLRSVLRQLTEPAAVPEHASPEGAAHARNR